MKCKKEKDWSKVKGNQECERKQRERRCKRTRVYKEHKEVKRARVQKREKGKKTLRERRALFPRAVDHYLSPGPLRVGHRGSGRSLSGCFFSTLVWDLRVLFFMLFTHTHIVHARKRQEDRGVCISTKERKMHIANTNNVQFTN